MASGARTLGHSWLGLAGDDSRRKTKRRKERNRNNQNNITINTRRRHVELLEHQVEDNGRDNTLKLY